MSEQLRLTFDIWDVVKTDDAWQNAPQENIDLLKKWVKVGLGLKESCLLAPRDGGWHGGRVRNLVVLDEKTKKIVATLTISDMNTIGIEDIDEDFCVEMKDDGSE